jgi:hypothetical protein
MFSLIQYFYKKPNQFVLTVQISKVTTYNFGLEKYLTIVNNFELRRSFTKLHTSSHRLQIELGRYQGVPRHNRICSKQQRMVPQGYVNLLIQLILCYN